MKGDEMDFTNILTIITVIIGWMVVSKQHNNRETRKEIRQFLDKTILLIESLVNRVDACYTCKNIDQKEKKKQVLVIDIMRLDKNLSFLQPFISESISASDVNEAITSCYSFDDINVSNETSTKDLNNTATKLYELIDNLEKAYRDTYHKRKKQQN